jgi:hypothetical protein
VRRLAARVAAIIRVEAVWLAVAPIVIWRRNEATRFSA